MLQGNFRSCPPSLWPTKSCRQTPSIFLGIPINPAAKTLKLAFNGACTTEQVDGEGFGLDATNPNRVFLCKASCEAYRNVLRTASLYAAQNGQSPIAVPVFSHLKGCPVSAGSPK